MSFLRGKALLPEDTPLIQRNPWECISVIYEDNRKESMIPLVDAQVELFLPESRDRISQGTTSDDGEFFIRAPRGESYFLEISRAGKLIMLTCVPVDQPGEIDLGILDSLTTAYGLYVLQQVFQGEPVEPERFFQLENLSDLRSLVEQSWKEGRGLEELKEYHCFAQPSPSISATLDPFGLVKYFRFEPDRENRRLWCEWEAAEPGRMSLVTRSYRSRHFHRTWSPPHQTRGCLTVETPAEFEGYLYFLEFQNEQGFLGRTPLSALRTSLRPLVRKTVMVGRQDGPVIVSRLKKTGEHRVPGHTSPFGLRLQGALQKQFEGEIDLEFSRKVRIPRYLTREGFQDLELNIFFPQDHSFLWGPVNESPGVELVPSSLEALIREWKVIPVTMLPDSIVEIGYSLPFSELSANREGENYRLFSDTDLSSPITIISFRKLDSLGLECTMYYRGCLLLRGEGLFKGYLMRITLEGKFEEDREEGFFTGIPGEISGNVECRLNYVYEEDQEK